MTLDLKAARLDVGDYFEWLEMAYEKRWTDGLPVVPPTPDRVQAFVDYIGRNPLDEVGEIPPKYGIATIEKLAVNAVMGGCKPEYFPVVIAAIEAMLEPPFNLNGVQTTTHNNEPLAIISGPVVKQIGLNAHTRAFGSGYRANGTIGRAIRLIQWNLGGSYPEEPDKSCFAHPGQWCYVLAENQDANPWEAIHVTRGFPAESSCVTVFGCEAPHSVFSYGTAVQVLNGIAGAMGTPANNNVQLMGEALVVFNPFNAATVAGEGWSKRDAQVYLWQHGRVPKRVLEKSSFHPDYAEHHWPKWLSRDDPDEMIPLTERPEDIHVVVSGGDKKFCMVCPGWGMIGGLAVTKEIKLPRKK